MDGGCQKTKKKPWSGWWQLKYFVYFHPELWGRFNPFWRAYFSDGLVQPPTSGDFYQKDCQIRGIKAYEKNLARDGCTPPFGCRKNMSTFQASKVELGDSSCQTRTGRFLFVFWFRKWKRYCKKSKWRWTSFQQLYGKSLLSQWSFGFFPFQMILSTSRRSDLDGISINWSTCLAIRNAGSLLVFFSSQDVFFKKTRPRTSRFNSMSFLY